MSKLLEVLNLSKSYGKKSVLEDISFYLNKNEVIGIIGKNGAGKTTILKCILNLINNYSGVISIEGTEVKKNFEMSIKSIGAIIEEPSLYGELNGYENLYYLSKLRNCNDLENIENIIKIVNLENAKNQKFDSYSLGMKQRLGIAQALLNNPKILILDEPTNGLDPQGIIDLRNLIKKLKGLGISIIVSSHLLGEIDQVCDRVILIDKGVVVSEKVLICSEEIEPYIVSFNDIERLENIIKSEALGEVIRIYSGYLLCEFKNSNMVFVNERLQKEFNGGVIINKITMNTETFFMGGVYND